MKKIIAYISLFFLIFNTVFAQETISGKISDKLNNEPLVGATIFIPDLETGTMTNKNGFYEIKNLPKSKFLIQIKFIGYAQITQFIDLSDKIDYDIALEQSPITTQEVVITGSAISSDINRTSVSVVPLSKRDLITTGASNIISCLTAVPGISQITLFGNPE